MKILIAVPCMDQVAAPFAASLGMLEKDEKDQTVIAMQIGSLVYDSRNNLARRAVNWDADYVMWLDSDMSFPPDTLKRMVKHMESGLDIVTGLYFRRRSPFAPVLFKDLGVTDGKGHWEGYDDYPKDSLFEIGGCGFGCVMHKANVLAGMVLNGRGNWFSPYAGFGEDLSFCIRAKESGYSIWCDSTIKCGHVGQIVVDENIYETQLKG